MHDTAQLNGYASVAHCLVLTKPADAEAMRAALDSGFCPDGLAGVSRQGMHVGAYALGTHQVKHTECGFI